MTKGQKVFITACILALLAIVVVSVYNALPRKSHQPQPIAKLSQDPGGCSQCIAKNCYAAPCNMECRLVGDGCETIVMGGAAQPYEPETKSRNGDYAEFYLQRVLRLNNAMRMAGIEVGDTIERVNGNYAGSDLEFAKLVISLPAGTILRVWKRNGAGISDVELQ
jgi:hypothetical protein